MAHLWPPLRQMRRRLEVQHGASRDPVHSAQMMVQPLPACADHMFQIKTVKHCQTYNGRIWRLELLFWRINLQLREQAHRMYAMLARAAAPRFRGDTGLATSLKPCKQPTAKGAQNARECCLHAAPPGAGAPTSRKTGLEIAPWTDSPQNIKVRPPESELVTGKAITKTSEIPNRHSFGVAFVAAMQKHCFSHPADAAPFPTALNQQHTCCTIRLLLRSNFSSVIASVGMQDSFSWDDAHLLAGT